MSFEQYVLVGSTVRSYLSWLKDGGRLNALKKICSCGAEHKKTRLHFPEITVM